MRKTLSDIDDTAAALIAAVQERRDAARGPQAVRNDRLIGLIAIVTTVAILSGAIGMFARFV